MFDAALAELRAGREGTQWMWFVFPQLKCLGHSATTHYGIGSFTRWSPISPIRCLRLRSAVAAVEVSRAASLHALFGSPDYLKFR